MLLAVDVGLIIALYYGLHHFGVSSWLSGWLTDWLGGLSSILGAAVPAEDFQLEGTVDLLREVTCLGLSIYVGLWVYWMAKRKLKMPQHAEKSMVRGLRELGAESTDAPKPKA